MKGTPLGKILKGKVSCSDLLSCLYSLNTAECDLFFSLYGMSEISLDSLAQRANKDRSTVHRILEKLVMAGLCFKDSVSLENGGYRNIYYTIEPVSLVEKLTYDVSKIKEGLESAMEHFPNNFAERTGINVRSPS
ncbi:MAG: hypothetical protein QW597_04550 [Thermoplasmataceae archaeon]